MDVALLMSEGLRKLAKVAKEVVKEVVVKALEDICCFMYSLLDILYYYVFDL